jgi:hypothetical protein
VVGAGSVSELPPPQPERIKQSAKTTVFFTADWFILKLPKKMHDFDVLESLRVAQFHNPLLQCLTQ